ncbi:hypothetical protein AGLY_010843 [Aphis glycines]|uniref:Uncharacterized protein n=1 Tax=Aphis glycines TaxID=307491 RepID=A0A6G0TGX2_APHGL|nr:hypothetical protein AGLY_010843 [Aphis glycines]
MASRSPKRSTISRGSPSGSSLGTVGPLAMAVSGSPTTSDRTSDTTGHSGRTHPISRPPLTRDSALRTAFSCSMDAPAADSSRVARTLSGSGTVGEHSSAEPPPDTSTTSRSPADSRDAVPATMRSVLATDRPSGALFLAASRTHTLDDGGGRRVPTGTLTTASLRRSPSALSTSRAMSSTALPKPMA